MSRPPTSPRALARRLLADQESLLVLLLLVIGAAVVVAVPDFLHVETAFTVARSSMVSVLFALGVLLVLISGGIDVSFLAVGILSAYLTVRVLPTSDSPADVLAAYAIAIAIGAALGGVNAAVVLGARVSTLIATLATGTAFTGAMFAFVGGTVVPVLPGGLAEVAGWDLVTAPGAVRGTTRLNVLVLLVAAVCVGVWALLRHTVAGRGIYAVGGDETAAARAAVSVPRTRALVFVLSGALYGAAGMTHVLLSGRADPTTFTGGELSVLAAVVLGGALITGGAGSVRGTVLGVLVINVIGASLIPLGVASIWQQATIGLLLLLGVGLQGLVTARRPERPILAESGAGT
jgi:simple sugar transport system permease protein